MKQVLLCTLLFACAKEMMIPEKSLEIGSSEMLESARKYFYAHIDPTASSIVQYGSLPAYWDDAQTKQIADGSSKIFVPATDWTIGNPDMTFKRYLVFSIDQGKIINGEILEFYGYKYNVHLNADVLLHRYNQDSIPEFNGSVILYDPSYRHRSGVKFQDGVKMPNAEVYIKTSNSDELFKMMKPVLFPP
jgi:hypothetical protein